MKREYGLDQVVYDAGSLVTVGTFDGVHLGHQAILRYLLRRAAENGGRSVVVSFDPHPREVVRNEPVPLLTTIDERADLFERLGVDRFIVIPFTKDFARLSAEDFVEQVLVARIGLKEIVIGYDHGFGRGRGGDAALLERLGRQHGFTVDVIPPQVVAEHVVSSTEIRQLLVEAGDVREAARLLGRPYALSGTVVEGAGRGRTIGFPTANLAVSHPRKVIPRPGVYAVSVAPGEAAHVYGGMMNIGRRPTFENEGLHLEVHLLDFRGDLYGRSLRIEFVERLRDERKFASVEALVEQLYEDRKRCMAALKAVP
ncbi:bifunctional riboflavin kinase/FAD synthetase [Rhodocaloribacter litoris]|uniref:bifunctional riboflavin kinase/FAD synthetase n=1 Tax=Rhodocaloribacter litoris TaxID=2558931 RepID=UPI0014237930|nr:bifunctional riboflavin kinase/FAD synthetase [Rhodocaloribacter litoris]QXD14793.1 bifunctional riboflavin kinase/FAD synthetase [Rhodocaloribacter litoris]GIV59120.1 MAG: riboflavin biosynthesis protein [Rhodothermaceae bacterium]